MLFAVPSRRPACNAIPQTQSLRRNPDMTEDAMNATPEAVQSDVLTEQPEAPRPQEVKPQAEEPAPEVKAEKTGDQKRAETVKAAIEKATKAPEDKPKEAKAEKTEEPAKPERQPDGKFVAKVPAEGDVREEPKRTAFKDPPQRFDDAARSEWEAVPESVRGAIHRAQKEMETGIEKYRASAEAYETVREFDEMARNAGGNLRQTLERVVALEQAFTRSPVEGFQRIADHFGIDLRQLATAIVQQSPQQVNDQRARMQMADMQRQNQQLQRALEAERQNHQVEARRAEAMTEWQQFSASNPRATELEPVMAEFLAKYPPADNVPLRDRLADAYAFAVAKQPSAAHTGTEPALAQTQTPRTPNPAGRQSIAGSPSGEATSSKRKLSRAEATLKAMRAHGVN